MFCNEIINLDEWEFDDSYGYEGIYSEGARDKEVYISPSTPKNSWGCPS